MLEKIGDGEIKKNISILLPPSVNFFDTIYDDLKLTLKFSDDGESGRAKASLSDQNTLVITFRDEPSPLGIFSYFSDAGTMDDGGTLSILITVQTFGSGSFARKINIQWVVTKNG